MVGTFPQVQLEIEESSDLEVWSNEGKELAAVFLLAGGKKFLRFVLAPPQLLLGLWVFRF